MFLQQWSRASWKGTLRREDPTPTKYKNNPKESCLYHRVGSISRQRIFASFLFFLRKIRKNQKNHSEQQPRAGRESAQLLRVESAFPIYQQLHHVWILRGGVPLHLSRGRLYPKRQSDQVHVMALYSSQSFFRYHEILQLFPSWDPMHELGVHVPALHGQRGGLLHQEGNAGAAERVLQPNAPQHGRPIDAPRFEEPRLAAAACRGAG